MRAHGCLALGKVLLSNSLIVCAIVSASQQKHAYIFMLWSSENMCFLKLFQLLSWGLANWSSSCKIQGEHCPSALHSDKSRGDVLQSRRRVRPWLCQTTVSKDPHSEIIWQGFCYVVTAPVSPWCRAWSEPMQLIQEILRG